MLKSARPDARFQLLGATDAENRTAIDRATVKGWEDEGLIDYLGTVEDVRPVVELAHCVVLPSYREGAPRTLIEAAALARPVIATNVPGCRAVVDEGQNGFLCEVRNAASLAAACHRFLDLCHEERVAMGRAGRRKMEREYDQRIVIEAYQAAIDDLVPDGRQVV
jgi:glycosyltransferase involved in cell wall biosynthesis